MKALIDGDYLVYRHAFAVQREYHDYGKLTASWNLGYNLIEYVDRVLGKIGTEDYLIFLGNGISHREKDCKIIKYKENRKDAPKPRLYKEARQIIIDNLRYEIVEDIEADDALGIAQRDDTVIVTVDKDLRMIPGYHYNIKTGRVWSADPLGYIRRRKKVYSTGFKHFCRQMLTGDNVDNIPGLPGAGNVTAYKLLKDVKTIHDCWNVVLAKYKEKEKDSDFLFENAHTLWILQAPNQYFADWAKLNKLSLDISK